MGDKVGSKTYYKSDKEKHFVRYGEYPFFTPEQRHYWLTML